jgi:isopenicillin N synthase-like dioxygenase
LRLPYGLNGYTGKGREAVGTQRADPVESLVFNRDLPLEEYTLGVPEELRAAAWVYYGECEKLVRRLMRLTAVSLGRSEGFFDGAFERPSCALRLANYDTLDKSQEFLYAEHTDYTGFTLLAAEPVAGLEIRLPGTNEWVAVDPPHGALVVNSGDLIQQWSDDVFHSTLHRVRNVGLPERSAIVFFSGPSDDTLVESRNYPPVLAGEHLRERLRRSVVKH